MISNADEVVKKVTQSGDLLKQIKLESFGRQFRNIYRGGCFSLSLIAETGNNQVFKCLGQTKHMIISDFDRR